MCLKRNKTWSDLQKCLGRAHTCRASNALCMPFSLQNCSMILITLHAMTHMCAELYVSREIFKNLHTQHCCHNKPVTWALPSMLQCDSSRFAARIVCNEQGSGTRCGK